MKGKMLESPFAGKTKGPKTLQEVRLSRAADGKMIVNHHFTGYEHEPEKHEFSDGGKMLAHVGKVMGCK